MNENRARLIRCFQAVFPGLSDKEAMGANTTRVGAWDSVATVTLAAVIEEEFQFEFTPEEMERLTSFQAALDCLNESPRVS